MAVNHRRTTAGGDLRGHKHLSLGLFCRHISSCMIVPRKNGTMKSMDILSKDFGMLDGYAATARAVITTTGTSSCHSRKENG